MMRSCPKSIAACLLLVLMASCGHTPPQPLKGFLIVGPPEYLRADLYLNGKHYGQLSRLDNFDPEVDRELSYRYPECQAHDWVGFDLRSPVAPLPAGRYRIKIEKPGFSPNVMLVDHPANPETGLTRLFLEPLDPLPPESEKGPRTDGA